MVWVPNDYLCDVCNSSLKESSICDECGFDNSYQFYNECNDEKIDLIYNFVETYLGFSDDILAEALIERFGLMSKIAEIIAEEVYA